VTGRGRERLRDQAAQPGVVGRVHPHDAVAHLLAAHPRLVEALGELPAEPRVGRHQLDVGVLRREPGRFAEGHLHPAHRLFALQDVVLLGNGDLVHVERIRTDCPA
jgi:hypothetical protein